MKKLLAMLVLVLLAVSSAAGAEKTAPSLTTVELRGKWGFTDPDGKMVISPKFYQALGFSEGLVAVTVTKGDKWGFIDQTGKMVIAPQIALPDVSGGL